MTLQLLAKVLGRDLGRAASLCHEGRAVGPGVPMSWHGDSLHCCSQLPVANQQGCYSVDSNCTLSHHLVCPHVWQLVSAVSGCAGLFAGNHSLDAEPRPERHAGADASCLMVHCC